ncbi:MAG: VWA domain-containing protein [Acidobacteriota bacterium]
MRQFAAITGTIGASLAVSLAVVVSGQEPSAVPRGFGQRVEVRLGTLEVAVLDADGQPVCDLQAADFALRIGGEEWPITHFEPCRSPGAAVENPIPAGTMPAPTATPEPDKETVWVIVVDNRNLSVFNRNAVLRRLGEFVRARFRPPARATVLALLDRVEVVCPLTSDPDSVIASLEALRAGTSGIGSSQALLRMGEAQIREIWEEPSPLKPDRMMMTARLYAGQILASLRQTCANLERLMRSLSGVPGRKALVYVSDGLPLQPARELFTLVTEYFPALTTAQGGAESFRAEGLFTELGDYAVAAGVAFYPIDAQGVQVSGGFEAERRESYSSEVADLLRHNHQQTLSYLAVRTGGLAVLNTNNFGEALERIATAVEATYSLGFPLEHLETDQPLRVELGLRTGRKLRLHYRPVFVNRLPETAVADRTSAGLLFDLADNPLRVSVATEAPRVVSKDRCAVPLVIRVPLASLVLPAEGGELSGAAVVFYQAADAEGHRSQLARIRHPLRIPLGRASAVRELAISTEVEVGAGEGRVSVGVLDEVSGQAGYATARVDCSTRTVRR